MEEENRGNVEKLVLKSEIYEETLFVARESNISDGDIEDITVDWEATSPGHYEVNFKLTESGGEKLKRATESRVGKRMAIVVGGKIMTAPVINGVLRRSITISSADEEGFLVIVAACEKLLGKDLSRKPALDSGAQNDKRIPETAPYTAEEYLERKAFREERGIFYLEELPPKNKLDSLLVAGATEESVIIALGKSSGRTKLEDGVDRIGYEIAPEKRSENGDGKLLLQGISIIVNNGKVLSWDYSYSGQKREQKVVGLPERKLETVLPQVDFSAEEFDMIGYLEKIEIPKIDQGVSETDLYDILFMVASAASVARIDEPNAMVKNNCDIFRFLARNFPEVASLSEEKSDHVSLKLLDELLMPYSNGEKKLFERASAIER